jgi:hypothetical protein
MAELMHVEPVTFDRIFDVIRGNAKGIPYWTTFGFEFRGKKVYGARVNGHPQISEGTPLLVVMKRQGDWTAMLGWAEVATGKLVIEDGRKDAIFHGLFYTACAAIVGPLFVLLWLESRGVLETIFGLFVLQLLLVQPMYGLLRRRNLIAAKQALIQELQRSSTKPSV